MRKLRTLDQYEEDFFQKHPEEIGSYLEAIFDEFAADGNTAALLASLRVIAKVKGKSTLVVTDKSGMAKQGASINFVSIDNKQKFELNKSNLAKMDLKVSSSLVQLAIVVE